MKYHSIDDYIDSQTPEHQAIFQLLRDLVLDSAPYIQEGISWNVPFFHYRGGICYFSKFNKVPYIAFVKGFALSDEAGLLEAKDRKQVKSLSIHSLADLQSKKTYLQETLQGALLWNEQNGKIGAKW